MYQIVCDNHVLHDLRVDDLFVINARCSLEVNKTGSLTFNIAPNHPYYDVIQKHTSEITLYQDDVVLFRGRVLNDEVSFENIKTIECEGDLSYFLDSIQRGKEYNLSGDNAIETYLKDLVEIHNSQVDERKRFVVGRVDIVDPNDTFTKISNYEDTLTILFDKLVNLYGGYLIVRHDGDTKYLDYVSELTNVCNQRIEFGKNIVDMTRYIRGEDVYTALVPLGATKSDKGSSGDEETYERRLTISSLPNSVNGTISKVDDYIYDVEAVQRWGWLWRVQKWDDVKKADNLLAIATEELKNSTNATLSIELTAVDLHLLDVEVDRIKVGDLIHCVSLPHSLNTIMIVKSVDIDIDDPSRTTVKLVSPTGKMKGDASISHGNTVVEKDIAEVKESLNDGYATYDDVETIVSDLRDWVNNSFLPMGGDGNVDLSAYATITDVNSAFLQLATALEGV